MNNFTKKNALFLPCLILLSSLIFSCEKDEKPEPKSNLAKMIAGETSKNWKLTGMEAEDIDLLEEEPECMKDNYIILYANKKVEYVEGENECDVVESEEGHDTWSISSDGKTLIIGEMAYTVIEITDSKMVLKSYASFEDLIPTFTYEAL